MAWSWLNMDPEKNQPDAWERLWDTPQSRINRTSIELWCMKVWSMKISCNINIIFYFKNGQSWATNHDKEDIPDEEAWPARCPTRCRYGWMFVLGILIDTRGDSLPCLHMRMQFPLLLIHKGLHIDTGDLAAVLFKVELHLWPFRGQSQSQILWNSTHGITIYTILLRTLTLW